MRAPDTLPADGRCAVCERYVGPVQACPYCGESVVVRPALRWLRWCALALALAGLAFLYLMARFGDPPTVAVGDLGVRMNYALVRVEGVVEREPYVSNRSGEADYCSFLVDDGSGSLRVAARGAVARALVDRDKLPRRGERVVVTGKVQVEADGKRRLWIEAAESVSGLNVRAAQEEEGA